MMKRPTMLIINPFVYEMRAFLSHSIQPREKTFPLI